MKAIVTQPFPGRPDGEMAVKHFAVGDEVHGDLAKVAISEKWAEPVVDGGERAPAAAPAVAAAPAPAKGGKGGKASRKEPEPAPPADSDDQDEEEVG